MTVRRNFSSGVVVENGTTSKTYTFGFTAQAGSQLVVLVHANATTTTPSGWVKHRELLGGFASYLFAKVSDGSETSISWTQNGDRPAVAMVWEYDSSLASTSAFYVPVANGVAAGIDVYGTGAAVLVRLGATPFNTTPDVTWTGAAEIADRFVWSSADASGNWASSAEIPYTASGSHTVTVNGMPSGGEMYGIAFVVSDVPQLVSLAQYSGAAASSHTIVFDRPATAGADVLLFGISAGVPTVPSPWVTDFSATFVDCAFILRLPGASNSGATSVSLPVSATRALVAVVVEDNVAGAPTYSNFGTSSGDIVAGGTLIGTGLHTYPAGGTEYAVFCRTKNPSNAISGSFASLDSGFALTGQAKVEPTASYEGHFIGIGRKSPGDGMSSNGVTATLSPPISATGVVGTFSNKPGIIVYTPRAPTEPPPEEPPPTIGDPLPHMLSDGSQWHPVLGADHTHAIGDLPATLATDAEVTAAITAHEAAADPHPVYLTQTEGDVRYMVLGSDQRTTVDPDPPSTPSVEDLWLDTNTGTFNEYVGSVPTSLWSGVAPTGGGTGAEGDSITLATRFYPTVDGTITGLAVFNPGDTSLVVGIYSIGSPGTILSQQSYGAATRSSGWTTFAIPPAAVTAATSYFACVWKPNGASYYRALDYFTEPLTASALTAPAATGPEPNGMFALGGGSLSYPTMTYQSTSYFVDPQLVTGSPWVGRVQLALSGEAGGHTVQDEGASLATRSKLNFKGSGVLASDDAANDATIVTVSTTPVQATWSMGPSIAASTGGYKWRAKRAYTITKVSADLGTAPGAGESFSVDVTKNGVAVLSSSMVFSSGDLTKDGAVSLGSLATDDVLEVMVSSVTGTAAQRLTVNVEMT